MDTKTPPFVRISRPQWYQYRGCLGIRTRGMPISVHTDVETHSCTVRIPTQPRYLYNLYRDPRVHVNQNKIESREDRINISPDNMWHYRAGVGNFFESRATFLWKRELKITLIVTWKTCWLSWKKNSAGQTKKPQRAGFGPRAVLCPPLL
jgi:hypothetical protein